MSLRLLLGLGAVVLYALLSHLLMLYAADAPWAIAALFGPLLLPCLALAWRRGHWPALTATIAALIALILIVAAGGLGDVRRLYLAQHAGVHLSLGIGFAASLRGPGLSAISRIAHRLHGGQLTPAMRLYTTRVTRLWVGYFFGMAALSVVVFVWAPWSAWSLLANLLTPLAIALVFVGEYLVRYRLHPEFERISLAAAVRAFQQRDTSAPLGR
ncbi:hypothetical protein HLB44_17040 [Aquincola sp. S2]|uniref:Transmembrane protein n=1 Tax=Pseudaquabacterium terrae TaxID=2732868 RepID=A0ABX2EJB6_9BURK|nr:hypothetical protein [Aquabacterium terrae]NRF68699.1 hypothetical protein [Aquabacterium terrae]